MRSFETLTEQEILALAIALEEEDARIYDDFADGLKEKYLEQAEKFKELRREEDTTAIACSNFTNNDLAITCPSSGGRMSGVLCKGAQSGWCARSVSRRCKRPRKQWKLKPNDSTKPRRDARLTPACVNCWATWQKRSGTMRTP